MAVAAAAFVLTFFAGTNVTMVIACNILKGAALGWILTAGSFDTNPTGEAAVAAIKAGYIWVPVITCVIGVACMLLFDLDKHYENAVKDLEAGRWKGSK